MIHSLLIVSGSGLVIFNKQFSELPVAASMLGSLLTAVIELSTQATGNPATYIELGALSVTIVVDSQSRLFCALFHDPRDGEHLMSLIASRVLAEFLRESRADSARGTGPLQPNCNAAQTVALRIPALIRGVLLPILEDLQGHRAISKALLVLLPEAGALNQESVVLAPTRSSDAPFHITGHSSTPRFLQQGVRTGRSLDRLSLVGNLNAALSLSAELLEGVRRHVGNNHTSSDMPAIELYYPAKHHVVVLQPLGQAILVVVFRQKPGADELARRQKQARSLLDASENFTRVFRILGEIEV